MYSCRKSHPSRLYRTATPPGAAFDSLTRTEQTNIYRQAVVGWLQSLLFIVMVVQSLFAGALRALPPELGQLSGLESL